jgi:hypothetical protein
MRRLGGQVAAGSALSAVALLMRDRDDELIGIAARPMNLFQLLGQQFLARHRISDLLPKLAGRRPVVNVLGLPTIRLRAIYLLPDFANLSEHFFCCHLPHPIENPVPRRHPAHRSPPCASRHREDY